MGERSGPSSSLPVGLPVVLDPDVRQLDGGRVLLGGDPGRLLRLRSAAPLDRLACGEPVPPPVQALARTLLDGGFAHPRPGPAPVVDVTVVVPVRDRAAELDRCLAALGGATSVLVVDDGSRDPDAVVDACRRHGAEVLRLPVNGGPAAARNAGLAATSTGLVAFLDSDCTVPPGWLAGLLGHFADESVAAVAPRVRAHPAPLPATPTAHPAPPPAAPARSSGVPQHGGAGGLPKILSRYAAARGPLDLGPREARVRPGSRVSYVPTAALVVRRAALPTPAFDPALRYGEDVDLVWRLTDAGWTVRYDPRTVVEHAEPERWSAWLARRHRYGTSAAPLAARHPDRLAPLVLPPWTTAAWLLLAARRPLPALAVAAVPAVRLHQKLRRAGVRTAEAAAAATAVTARGVVATGSGLGGAGLVVTAPPLLALLTRRRARGAAAAVLLAPPLLEWAARRPRLDPVRWTAARLVDDLAYASGVWRGCWSGRSLAPLRPRSSRPR